MKDVQRECTSKRCRGTYALKIKQTNVGLEQVQSVWIADVFSQELLVQSAIAPQKDRQSLDIIWIIVLARLEAVYERMFLQICDSFLGLCVEGLSSGDEESFTVLLST
jgi:hypothetical protein